MIDDKTLDDARRMLVALLAREDDDPVEGLAEMTTDDRLFLLTTCSSSMIEEAICAMAGYHVEDALNGLETLVISMREHMREKCAKRGRLDA